MPVTLWSDGGPEVLTLNTGSHGAGGGGASAIYRVFTQHQVREPALFPALGQALGIEVRIQGLCPEGAHCSLGETERKTGQLRMERSHWRRSVSDGVRIGLRRRVSRAGRAVWGASLEPSQ